MTKRKALGSGLEALLGGKQKPGINDVDYQKQTESVKNIISVPIDKISRNLNQPRKKFSEESLLSLGNSIIENGMVSPVILRQKNNNYELVAGERRWRACQIIKQEMIEAIVIEASDKNSALLALVENVQREQLNVVEEAAAFLNLHQAFDMSHEEISKLCSKSRPHITNLIRLNDLSDYVKSKLLNEEIEMGHARAVLSLSKKDQDSVITRAIKKMMSVRSIESYVRDRNKNKSNLAAVKTNSDTTIIERELSEILGAALKISATAKGKGQITIRFGSLDELQGIITKIKK